MTQADEFYAQKIDFILDYILSGSRALKLYHKDFREAGDYDILVGGKLIDYLEKTYNVPSEDYTFKIVEAEDYDNATLEFQLIFKDGSKIDFFRTSDSADFEVIKGIKVNKQQNIVDAKNRIIVDELGKEEPNTACIIKHLKDLYFLKGIKIK